jgi:hypothetical protein
MQRELRELYNLFGVLSMSYGPENLLHKGKSGALIISATIMGEVKGVPGLCGSQCHNCSVALGSSAGPSRASDRTATGNWPRLATSEAFL